MSVKILSIIYLVETISLYIYIIKQNTEEDRKKKIKLLFIGKIVAGIYINVYINIPSVRSVILISICIIILYKFYLGIYTLYLEGFRNYNTYFICFILARIIENIYVVVVGVNSIVLMHLLLIRFIQVYYLFRCTMYSDSHGNIDNVVGKLNLVDGEINSRVSYIIANLSHELKTPINVIISALEIINLEKKVDIGVSQEIGFIKKECAIIMDMVQMIVNIQKIHDDQDNSGIRKYNIVELIENITDAFNYEYEKGKIIFDTYEEEICVNVNKSLVQQAIMGIIHTVICINPASAIDIHIETRGISTLSILIYNSQIGYIKQIVSHIINKIPMNYKDNNMIHILTVQVLLETIKTYGGTIIFEQGDFGESMGIVMPIDRDKSKQTSKISEWNIDELREGIKMKYLA